MQRNLPILTLDLACVLHGRRFLATTRYCVLNFRMHGCKLHALMISLTLHKCFIPNCQLWRLSWVTLGSRELHQIHASVQNIEQCPESCATVLRLVWNSILACISAYKIKRPILVDICLAYWFVAWMSWLTVNCVLCTGTCLLSDQRVRNSSRFLIKLPEHTWGLPAEPDLLHWSNKQFHKRRDGMMSCQ